VENEVMASHLQALLTPAIFNQQSFYRQLGLRNRILNLPLMVDYRWFNIRDFQKIKVSFLRMIIIFSEKVVGSRRLPTTF
jgi:hypothetical protein